MASSTSTATGERLISCALYGDVDTFTDLVRNGVDVTYRTKGGTSVLHSAAMGTDKKMMFYLFENHPSCIECGKRNDKKKGFNALHYWCKNNGDISVFDLFTKAGFDFTRKTAGGQTPLDLVKGRGDHYVQYIENILKGKVVDEPLVWTDLHQSVVDNDQYTCLSLSENNIKDVMTRASSKNRAIPQTIQKYLPPKVTPMELALFYENDGILQILTSYTDNDVIERCLKMNRHKTNSILEGIKKKLSMQYKGDYVVRGTLRDMTVFVVFSTKKTHRTETSIAGYRVLFYNLRYTEKGGWDEGRAVLHYCHSHNYVLSDADKIRVDKAIEQENETLWNNHSNIRGILSSPVKYQKGQFLLTPCVVIVCSFKSFIPNGESNFPSKIYVKGESVPVDVDVREGFFKLVVNNPIGKHVPLKMGGNIGTNDGTTRHGTIGPLVEYMDRLCFITCAHVMYSEEECWQPRNTHQAGVLCQRSGLHSQRSTERLAFQPVKESEGDLECGRVVCWDYALERRTSIDIAIVEITDQTRLPTSGGFTVYDQEELDRIGYATEEPTFDSGKTGRPTPTSDEETQPAPTSICAKPDTSDTDGALNNTFDTSNDIIIFGSMSGATSGKYRNSTSTRFTQKMYGKTKASERYCGMLYIENSQCGETHCKLKPLAVRGDSGAGVFQRKSDNSLECIGVLVAVDNTDSALVIPVGSIQKHFQINFKKFQCSS
ncbi:uncharacterized protein LOC132552757 [Ylistrum balloti]|uniref:uncharacterized protein LOC132552757 n=1 Tax=Ylistrum balloti TaxID=509963 RepID=UPI002905BB98|nr:uncharacterized protein LOC132552757 [Ylistrum balloti]